MKNAFLLFALFAAATSTPARAEQLKFLPHGIQAFAAFSSAIDSARKSIDLATFIFEPCHSSTQVLLEKLTRAAKRGVRVRILLDGIGHLPSEQDQLANMFAMNGIEIRFYNINCITTLGLNLRLHEKLTLIDNDTYIVGGRNISDEYFGMSTEQNWIDSDMMVTGRSALQAAASFQNIWDGELTSQHPGQPAQAKSWAQYCGARLSPKLVAGAKQFLATQVAQVMTAIPERSCADVEFVSDQSDFASAIYGGLDTRTDTRNASPGDEYMSLSRLARKGTAGTMINFVSGARSRLDVTNYFYTPVGKEQEAFAAARDRHVAIDVVTNQDMDDGPALFQQAEEFVLQTTAARESTGTMKITAVSSKGMLRDLNILSPAGAHFLVHSKFMVRDNKDALVGSYNLDSRSYNQNLESYVIAHECPTIAADVASEGNWVRKVRDSDLASRRIPPKEEPSFAAKLFADLNMILF